MKIVHITFSDDGGGAAIAAYRLHSAMRDYGLDSQMVVMEKKHKDKYVHEIFQNTIEMFLYKINVYIVGEKEFLTKKGKGRFSLFQRGNIIKKNSIVQQADVIFLHWINRGLMNVDNIESLLKMGKRVIWVMHDMFPMTGGCHHSLGCDGYKNKCYGCCYFKVGSNAPTLQLVSKMKLKQYGNMYWVAQSKWMYKCAKASNAINFDNLLYIPYVASKAFSSVSSTVAREALSLDKSKKYVLYGADGVVNNPYKGFPYFLKCMDSLSTLVNHSYLDSDDIEILIFGADGTEIDFSALPFKTNCFGEIKDERVMSLLYNASDVYLMTSIAESGPLTVQECVLCGTAVVAFDVGGVPDYIDSESKGIIIRNYNIEEMSNALFRILQDGIAKDNSCMQLNNNLDVISQYVEVINK